MPYIPSPIRREGVITKAAQEICRFIEAEELGSGDLLPAETRLSQMLGISRNSVREALRVLHGLGFVDKSDGKRVVVASASQRGKGMFDESVLMEAAPIAHEARCLIAQKCAELAAARLVPAEILSLENAFAALEDAVRRRDMGAAKRAHDAFYGVMLTGARNPLLVAMFNQAHMARLSNLTETANNGFSDRRHLKQHRALMQALRERDSRLAGATVRKHFRSLGAMMAFVATEARGPGGRRPPHATESSVSHRQMRVIDGAESRARSRRGAEIRGANVLTTKSRA